jgi:hypothetical protein
MQRDHLFVEGQIESSDLPDKTHWEMEIVVRGYENLSHLRLLRGDGA